MIFHQPIILASEFVTHAVLIVLMGVIIVEYFVHSECIKEYKEKTRAFYTVATMTVLGVVWVFLDFFASVESPLILFLRYALLLCIIASFFYVTRIAFSFPDRVRIPKKLGITLVAAILLFMLFDVLYHTTGGPILGVLYGLSRIVGVTVYYYFIMRYLIINDSHEHL